jgi:hypothetical protein
LSQKSRSDTFCATPFAPRDLGKPDEALKYLKEALEIFKRIGTQPQIKIVLKNIDIIKEEKRK